MLERRAAANGVVFYESPLLRARGVRHAFSTRIGGLSPAPFDSLNLGNPSGCDVQDDYPRIYENYRLLQDAIGIGGRERCWVHQVHGGGVARVRRGEGFESGVKADAIATDDPARIAAVRVADCVPVLIATDDGRRVAAVHAGWRGVIAGVVAAAVEGMATLGVVPAEAASPCHPEGSGSRSMDLGAKRRSTSQVPLVASDHPLGMTEAGPSRGAGFVAAIGPCIGIDPFEVGSEVLAEFERVFRGDAPIRRRDDGKGHVDLRAAIRLQLLGLGLTDARIDATDRCTVRDAGEFFSHRRDRGVTGRMAAIISPVS